MTLSGQMRIKKNLVMGSGDTHLAKQAAQIEERKNAQAPPSKTLY